MQLRVMGTSPFTLVARSNCWGDVSGLVMFRFLEEPTSCFGESHGEKHYFPLSDLKYSRKSGAFDKS